MRVEESQPNPGVIIIFGAGGDLTWRKLIPSLYSLCCKKLLPEKFAVIGVDMKAMNDDEFREHLFGGAQQFLSKGEFKKDAWKEFAAKLVYVAADFKDNGAFQELSKRLDEIDRNWDVKASRIFYQATQPSLVPLVVEQLNKVKLCQERSRTRIVLEKPFGHDLTSAQALNLMLLQYFSESQIYRIDHYLGKETVQNILAFRFSNGMFEPLWDRRYIDNVQITVAETVGVEHRGPYYENAGALRDMIQNHLLQILCLVAMEPMVNFDADEIRNKKVDVMHAIRCIQPDEVQEYAIRGQYRAGRIQDEHVLGYRSEPGVEPDSRMETFAAVKLFVDNWRWQDVPFYLRTGKRLAEKVSVATIQFKPVPHRSFPPGSVDNWEPNRLVLAIQPDEGILLTFEAKQPGARLRLNPVTMRFSYQETYHSEPPEAYETLLLDVMLGDATLFMRADQVEAAWSIIDPIEQGWKENPTPGFPNYAAGTWGPNTSDEMIARDGFNWFMPDYLSEASNTKDR